MRDWEFGSFFLFCWKSKGWQWHWDSIMSSCWELAVVQPYIFSYSTNVARHSHRVIRAPSVLSWSCTSSVQRSPSGKHSWLAFLTVRGKTSFFNHHCRTEGSVLWSPGCRLPHLLSTLAHGPQAWTQGCPLPLPSWDFSPQQSAACLFLPGISAALLLLCLPVLINTVLLHLEWCKVLCKGLNRSTSICFNMETGSLLAPPTRLLQFISSRLRSWKILVWTCLRLAFCPTRLGASLPLGMILGMPAGGSWALWLHSSRGLTALQWWPKARGGYVPLQYAEQALPVMLEEVELIWNTWAPYSLQLGLQMLGWCCLWGQLLHSWCFG